MPIRVHCPSCDDRFVTSKRYRGRRVRCSKCGERIKIRRKRAELLDEDSVADGGIADGAELGEAMASVPPIDATTPQAPGGSADILEYLAESGGPEARRAGAVYQPTTTDQSVSGDDIEPIPGSGADWKPPAKEPEASRPRGRLLAIGGGVAAILLLTGFAGSQWMGGDGAATAAAPAKPTAGKKPQVAKPRPNPNPSPKSAGAGQPAAPVTPVGPPVTVTAASLEVEDDWFSKRRSVRVTIQNDGEKPLSGLTLSAGIVSGVFEGSALFATEIEHRFDSPIEVGGAQEVVLSPDANSPLATQKLPPRAKLRAVVVSADWS